MKVRVRNRGHLGYVIPDGKPGYDYPLDEGEEKVVEFEKTLCICGNPVSPWRIVIDLSIEESEK